MADVRVAEQCVGSVNYELTESAKGNLRGMRSLYVSAAVRKGERITREHIRCVRPSMGLHPKHYASVIGRLAVRDLSPGERLRLEDLD